MESPQISTSTSATSAPSPQKIAVPTLKPWPYDWSALGFTPNETNTAATIPANVLVLSGGAEDEDYRRFLSRMPGPPGLLFRHHGIRYSAYRFNADLLPVSDGYTPRECQILRPGATMALPADGGSLEVMRIKSLADLPELTPASGLVEKSPPPCQQTSLSAFSLRGRASEFEANVVEATPLLGNICYSGQATVWYAPPNAGKTLIGLSLLSEAVAAKSVQPANVFYINADDSSAGFATKMRLMDDLGVHTLAPGHCGFECSKLSQRLLGCVREGSAKGIFIIIDTLKKFADLMNKGQASIFADACRQFVMNGGTILAFAHTNKNATSTGKLTYAGTADILQDFDAAYIMSPVEAKNSKTDRTVRVEAIKRRGGGIERTAYRYAAEDDISYEERLVSVQEVDPEWFEEFDRIEMLRNDSEVIEAIKAVIELGVTKKMQLAKLVARRIQVAERRVLRVLEAHTGDEPERHLWTFSVKERGAKVYALLDQPETAEVQAEVAIP